MGGKNSGTSRKRTTLPKHLRIDGVATADRRRRGIRFHLNGVAQIAEDHAEPQSFLRQRTSHRAMHLDARLARYEADMADGKAIDVTQYLAGCATWLRYAQALGLERRAKAMPSLHEYIEKTSTRPATEPSAQASLLPCAPPEPPVGCGGESQ